MFTSEAFRRAFGALAQSYRAGVDDSRTERILPQLPANINSLSLEDLSEVHSAIESLPIADVSNETYRLYLILSSTIKLARSDFLAGALDRLAELTNNGNWRAGVQVAAALFGYIVSLGDADIPNDETVRDRLTRWPLEAFLTENLDHDQQVRALEDYFDHLPAWAVESTSGVLLDKLELNTPRYILIAALFTSTLSTHASADQLLEYHIGGYLRALCSLDKGVIRETSRLQLMDASICSVILALEGGGGGDQEVDEATHIVVYHLRELPIRLRLELCHELLRVVRQRRAPADSIALVWLQLAEWLSVVSGERAHEAATALAVHAESISGSDKENILARVDLLLGRLEYRNGNPSGAARYARRAITREPENKRVQSQAAIILSAVRQDGSVVEDTEMGYVNLLQSLFLHAKWQFENKNPEQAIVVINEALATPAYGGEGVPIITLRRLRLLRAGAKLALSDANGALDELLLAVDVLVNEICNMPSGIPQEDRRNWFAESEAILDRAIQVALSISRSGEHLREEQLARLWVHVSSLRDVEIAFHSSAREARLAHDPLAQSYKDAHDELQNLEFTTERSSVRASDDFRKLFAVAKSVGEDLQISASLRPSFLEQLRARIKLGPVDVAAMLDKQELLVEFASYWTGVTGGGEMGARALVAFVLHPANGIVAFFGTAEFEPSVDRLAAVIADIDVAPRSQVDTPLRGDRLAKTLLQLAEHHEATKLVVIPDGPLRVHSVGALPLEDGYLDDHLPVLLAGNSSDLRRTKSRQTCGPPVAIGCSLGGSSGISRPAEERFFSSLTGPVHEARLIGSWSGATVITEDATIDKLAAIIRPKFLHFSGHGYYFEPVPHALREDFWRSREFAPTFLSLPRLHPLRGASVPVNSGLVFDSVNGWLDSNGESPGVFTAYDLSWLDLRGTEAVVLSGCRTGAGPDERWRGLVDLRRAALIAGAKCVIVALQNVPDVATSLLMLHLYSMPSSDSWPEKLRGAQRILRSATVADIKIWLGEWGLAPPMFGGRYLREILQGPADAKPFADPKYWASIVCYTSRQGGS